MAEQLALPFMDGRRPCMCATGCIGQHRLRPEYVCNPLDVAKYHAWGDAGCPTSHAAWHHFTLEELQSLNEHQSPTPSS